VPAGSDPPARASAGSSADAASPGAGGATGAGLGRHTGRERRRRRFGRNAGLREHPVTRDSAIPTADGDQRCQDGRGGAVVVPTAADPNPADPSPADPNPAEPIGTASPRPHAAQPGPTGPRPADPPRADTGPATTSDPDGGTPVSGQSRSSRPRPGPAPRFDDGYAPAPGGYRPPIEPEPSILGLSRHTRGDVGARVFRWFFVAVFAIILVQLVVSLLTV
jgi:hypothetical protein